MSIILKKYTYLLAASIAFAFAIGLFFTEKGAEKHEVYLRSVQERVNTELLASRTHVDKVLNRLPVPDGQLFSSLLKDTPYPYYLFRDTALVMWSQNDYVLTYNEVASLNAPVEVLENERGKFMAVTGSKQVNGSLYKLVSLIRLFTPTEKKTTHPSNQYNTSLFSLPPQMLNLQAGGEDGAVLNQDGKVLFYITPPEDSVFRSKFFPSRALLFLFLALLFFGVFVIKSIRQLRSPHRHGLGFGALVFFILLLRLLTLRYSVSYALTSWEVFNPQYNLSVLAPSIGSLLLNYLCILLLLVYVNSIYFRTYTYRRLLRSGLGFQALVSLLILLVSYVAYYMCYRELVTIYGTSLFTLDITQSITFGAIKVTTLLVFVCLSCLYFLIAHLVVSVFIRLTPDRKIGMVTIMVSVLIAAICSWFSRIQIEWIFLVHLLYITILYLTRLPRAFYGFRYPTTVYYFLGALACALLTTYVVENQELKKDLSNKKEFGNQFAVDINQLAEAQLAKDVLSITGDSAIKELFLGKNITVGEAVEQRVRNNYLNEYLDQYDINVLSFYPDGSPLDTGIMAQSFGYYRETFAKPAFSSSIPNTYLVNDAGEDTGRQYVSFVTVGSGADSAGFIVLNLKEQGASLPGGGEMQLTNSQQSEEYSYGIFGDNGVVSSSGTYNYESKFPETLLADSALYEKGIVYNGERHVGLVGSQGKKVVVSSKSWEWKGVLANFSFLYLILVIVVSIAIIGHAIHYGFSSLPLTYSTKIQVLLNAAFVLPLLIVLFFILQVIRSNYERNQQDSYLTNSRNIAANVLGYVEEYKSQRMSQGYFEAQIRQIAVDADLTINLYDTTGYIMLSSEPVVAQANDLTALINPLAKKQIVEQKENQLLLDESKENKNYTTAYTGLKSNNQELLGVLGVPYFDSKVSLERQMIDIIASVLIVFTGMLLLFLFVSYLAANLLIEPLRVLTRKISATSLNQPNEPLPWKSNDEIGALIKKYNQMLVNLDRSKQALSNTEKQSAWREMARQVAHEIKNPLTPMKLTLQQLQRTIKRDDPDALEKVSRAMETVIDQIDNIGHIAQSFSDIAKMPLPQNEVFEATSVLNKVFELYSSDKNVLFRKEIQDVPMNTVGDRKQFGASITNLIINAKQSLSDSRPGEITLRGFTHNETLMVEIQDNGSGIAKNIRSRVFLPNFTTKEGGTGLGLAMAKRIIEYAGGTIWFETEEDKGTTFFLSVPLAKS